MTIEEPMNPADVRVFVETELDSHDITAPTILLGLYRLGVEVDIQAIDKDRGVPDGVYLLGNNNGIPLQVFNYEEILELGGRFDDPGDSQVIDEDRFSWFIRDCDVAVALAQLLVNDHDIEAAHKLGLYSRYITALELIREVESECHD